MKQILLGLIFQLIICNAWAAESCRLPSTIRLWNYHADRAIADGRDWRNMFVPTDAWVLSLSWSSAFCDNLRQKRQFKAHAHQCGNNAFGLVVHGLWAQSAQANGNLRKHPRNCRDTKAISADTLQRYLCIIPDVHLMQIQWERHGTCDFRTPEQYFRQTTALFNQLTLPSAEQLKSMERNRATVIKRKFVELNRDSGLHSDSVWVVTRNGRLNEIRICYDPAFAFAACKKK